MGGRLNSMRHQWNSVGLPEEEWESKLTPEAADAIGPYMGKSKAESGATQGQAAPAAPGAGPPQGAIDLLRANPGYRDKFDQWYGAGAAAKILGQ